MRARFPSSVLMIFTLMRAPRGRCGSAAVRALLTPTACEPEFVRTPLLAGYRRAVTQRMRYR